MVRNALDIVITPDDGEPRYSGYDYVGRHSVAEFTRPPVEAPPAGLEVLLDAIAVTADREASKAPTTTPPRYAYRHMSPVVMDLPAPIPRSVGVHDVPTTMPTPPPGRVPAPGGFRGLSALASVLPSAPPVPGRTAPPAPAMRPNDTQFLQGLAALLGARRTGRRRKG